jgi:glycosyltransferase involved in cell wall biosynthesis
VIQKKIFITIPWFVPAFRAGGPVQSVANLVSQLHENVQFYIICQDVDLNGAVLDGIKVNEWVEFNDHTKVLYSTPGKISDTIVKQAEKLKPDILFIVGLFSWHFNIVPVLYCKGPKKILSVRGMLHPGALSQKRRKKKTFLTLFKLFEYHYSVHFHATDADERNFIINKFGEVAKVSVAGNFPNKIGRLPMPEKEDGGLRLITIALVSPMKNILRVIQALMKCSGRIQYSIYGPVKDEEYWDECKEAIKLLPANVTVTYHKEIAPFQVKDALREGHVFILPSKSENFGHAIFEALSAGRPVITSFNTPWKGLKEAEAGINVDVTDEEALVKAIGLFVNMDAEELKKWSEAAYLYSEKMVDVGKVRREYEEMFGIIDNG